MVTVRKQTSHSPKPVHHRDRCSSISQELSRTRLIPRLPILASKDQLLVMQCTRATIKAFWDSMQEEAPLPERQRNSALPPFVRQLSDEHLEMPSETLPFGHCKFVMRRTYIEEELVETPAIREGGGNNDAPRVTMPNFCENSMQIKKSKVYAYHIAAAHRAHFNLKPDLNLPLLQSVAQNKLGSNAYTIMHLCGNKWCVESDHLSVGTKIHNEQQTACHRGLQSATPHDGPATSQGYCRHTIRCWTVLYKGRFKETHHWV